MVQIITGTTGVADNGDLYYLTFVANPGVLSVVKANFTVPHAADMAGGGGGGAAATLGEPLTLSYGTPLPAGIWEVPGGAVYAGGEVTVRQVIIEQGG